MSGRPRAVGFSLYMVTIHALFVNVWIIDTQIWTESKKQPSKDFGNRSDGYVDNKLSIYFYKDQLNWIFLETDGEL